MIRIIKLEKIETNPLKAFCKGIKIFFVKMQDYLN